MSHPSTWPHAQHSTAPSNSVGNGTGSRPVTVRDLAAQWDTDGESHFIKVPSRTHASTDLLVVQCVLVPLSVWAFPALLPRLWPDSLHV